MNEDSVKQLDDLIEEFSRRAVLYGCDAIQVLASMHNEETGTLNRCFGRGNWYARQGMAHEFITSEDVRVGEFVKRIESEGGENA